jgi:tryptophan halogenase
MVKKVIVLGGGSAGFIAALTLKAKIPSLDVVVIRSKEIGIIGVGEGSTFAFTSFLHDYLKINERKFFSIARPTFKLGLRFIWGPSPYFNYTFGLTLDRRTEAQLPHADGFYARADLEYSDLLSALMTHDRAFERGPTGPKLHNYFAYHFENEKFVEYLEGHCRAVGARIVDDTVEAVLQNDSGVAGLSLKSGLTETADLYVDCSGFASVLLGKSLGEPFVPFKSSLFCDRAVIGGWVRTDETIKPYTTCETMASGWSWQIEHEARINRGYVYASNYISDDQAEREFRASNPRVGPTRTVRFVSGRYQRNWVKNVVAIGNAAGFVEPLEATALAQLALQSRDLTQTLLESDLVPRPSQVACFNRVNAYKWDAIRRFLAIHYKFNTRLDTPFWAACRADTDLAGAEPIVEYYSDIGPEPYWAESLFPIQDQFGFGGYVALLLGMKVPFHCVREPAEDEKRVWEARRARHRKAALAAMTVKESLDAIHSEKWRWQAR